MEKEDGVGNARKRKEQREYWNQRNNQNMRKWQVLVLWIGAMGVLLFLLSGYAKMRLERTQNDGSKLAGDIFSSMKKGSKLPWNTEENSILAVIECDGNPIFITKSDSVGSEVSGCIYHLAKGTKVVFASKAFKKEGVLKFQPSE